MYIAYSALRNINPQPQTNQPAITDNEILLRYQAYQTTCNKYHREIAAIQKQMPGWQPEFFAG